MQSTIDIDANTVKTAYENADLNNINREKYLVTHGNIIADVIITSANVVKKLLKDDGIFIASGIIKGRINDAYEKLGSVDFEVINM